MTNPKKSIITIPNERIMSNIHLIRGKKVMLDRDLAELYEVQTRSLNQSVTRNIERFPTDFMLQLNKSEFSILKSQFVTSSWGGTRKTPRAFTEHGILMLSSVLQSRRAVQVNIAIMRTFVQLREWVLTNRELQLKIEAMERKFDKRFKVVFDAIRLLVKDKQKPGQEIGFHIKKK